MNVSSYIIFMGFSIDFDYCKELLKHMYIVQVILPFSTGQIIQKKGMSPFHKGQLLSSKYFKNICN